jgi:glycosyltransferase involved in cell wall biosynthesis
VSICIPAYNCEQYIAATLHCLFKQTYANLEIIVADDGSADGTVELLQTITDARFKYNSLPNRGAAAARNTAYEMSSGEYIKFMDSDDLMSPDSIGNQLKKIIDQPDCIASAKWGRFYKEDATDFKLAVETVWKDLPGMDWLINSLIESGANMMQPGIFLIPRNIVEKAGRWNESLSLIDDFDFMIRVIAASKIVLFCEDALLMYRSGIGNSLSGKNSSKHMDSAFRALNIGIENLLMSQNDARSRLACANTYKRWSYLFYPEYMEYYQAMERNIDQLGGANISIVGSKSFNLLAKLLGWKNAKKIKMMLSRH